MDPACEGLQARTKRIEARKTASRLRDSRTKRVGADVIGPSPKVGMPIENSGDDIVRRGEIGAAAESPADMCLRVRGRSRGGGASS
jgi:hypothetical protein